MALAQAAILLTGLDPTGGPHAGHPTTQGVAILLIAAAAYGFAALAAAGDRLATDPPAASTSDCRRRASGPR